MNGKEKCRLLREIRSRIAQENDIELITRECSFRGECRGTCPRCEEELRWLEQQLEKKRALGRRIAVAGVSAGLALTLAGCSVVDALLPESDALTGIMPAPTEEIELMGEIAVEDDIMGAIAVPDAQAEADE